MPSRSSGSSSSYMSSLYFSHSLQVLSPVTTKAHVVVGAETFSGSEIALKTLTTLKASRASLKLCNQIPPFDAHPCRCSTALIVRQHLCHCRSSTLLLCNSDADFFRKHSQFWNFRRWKFFRKAELCPCF